MTIIVNFACTALAGREAELERSPKHLIDRMRREEPDLISVHYGRTEVPGEFAMVEVFKNRAAVEFHRDSPAERELGPGIRALMRSETRLFVFEEL